MKVLDLFCGLGGWSYGFTKCGFECVGVDIVNVGYPFELILCDVAQLNPQKLKGKFDVIVGSPPCRDFSKLCNIGKTKWKIPPSPDKGLIAVKAFLNIADIAKPRYWILENVPGLNKHLKISPCVKGKISQTQHRYFWGKFPQPLLPEIHGAKKVNDITGKLRSWKRAQIPTPISKAFAEDIIADQTKDHRIDIRGL